MMQRLLAGLIGLPRLMLVGLLILLAGGVLDVVYHSVPVLAPLLGRYLGRDGGLAHLVTFIGMLVTLLGVFVGRPRRARGEGRASGTHGRTPRPG
jgi:hypothetical protein